MEASREARTSIRRHLALVLAVALVAAILPPTAASAAEAGEWIVPAGANLPAGAEVVESLPVADALVVRSAEEPADAVAADAELAWLAEETDSFANGIPDSYLDDGVAATGAPTVWDDDDVLGSDGLVALIDTGVADVGGLEGSVAGEVNFSDSATGGDGFGHGTYMASLIAASGDLAPGVAPAAGILSLKVGDDEGATDLGKVLGALQWLEGPGRSLGIRVAVLALGVDPDSDAGQLLDVAVLHLAATGVLVITGSGNEADTLSSPATSPGSLAIGALDGDVAWEHSGSGDDRVDRPAPEILAPGVGVVGHLSPESTAEELALDNEAPGSVNRLEAGLVRGSGTSAAAALTAGVAALASDANPSLDGPALAEALLAGEGRLDAPATVAEAQSLEPTREMIDPEERSARAPLPGGRGAEQGSAAATTALDRAAPLAGRSAGGKGAAPSHASAPQALDVTSVPMPTVARWIAADWDGEAWAEQGDWAVARWIVARWITAEWSVARWIAADWTAEDWEDSAWDATDWDVARWIADDWDVARWIADDWDVARWIADDWDVARWIGGDWKVARWIADDWDVARWIGDGWSLAPPS